MPLMNNANKQAAAAESKYYDALHNGADREELQRLEDEMEEARRRAGWVTG